jgi:hypothetical protein
MFQASMRSGCTFATAQVSARVRIFSAAFSRLTAESFLESSSPWMRRLGSRMTAAATTGPNSAPRPASSVPATSEKPSFQAIRS